MATYQSKLSFGSSKPLQKEPSILLKPQVGEELVVRVVSHIKGKYGLQFKVMFPGVDIPVFLPHQVGLNRLLGNHEAHKNVVKIVRVTSSAPFKYVVEVASDDDFTNFVGYDSFRVMANKVIKKHYL